MTPLIEVLELDSSAAWRHDVGSSLEYRLGGDHSPSITHLSRGGLGSPSPSWTHPKALAPPFALDPVTMKFTKSACTLLAVPFLALSCVTDRSAEQTESVSNIAVSADEVEEELDDSEYMICPVTGAKKLRNPAGDTDMEGHGDSDTDGEGHGDPDLDM